MLHTEFGFIEAEKMWQTVCGVMWFIFKFKLSWVVAIPLALYFAFTLCQGQAIQNQQM